MQESTRGMQRIWAFTNFQIVTGVIVYQKKMPLTNVSSILNYDTIYDEGHSARDPAETEKLGCCSVYINAALFLMI